ncbi:hypothetical protein DM860_011938 [Cuscuta australis]|uniref:NAB domain-containing protein n=1 Tax=Cuscuta australis TaxID=267555 RepID=A0A328D8V7_9ASTE|nr:hypothetical protein DM860_011938 [Cuscuta australis]
MAKLSHADSRRMYSWWWDSHISPKNSKWLQENLTDMDAKVKAMIKLIEEDADSFARRAEMYYKKRPELMKLVEEFYRAYRALAERYDHATGVIHHAHKTMAEAFPNQVPMGGFVEYDSPLSSATDPQTPNSTPVRSLFESDELQDSGSKRNGTSIGDSNSVPKGLGLKQLNNLFGGNAKFGDGKVRKGLIFHESGEKEQSLQSNEANSFEDKSHSDLDQVTQQAQVEAEKEAGRIQYQQALEKLSELNSRISCAEEESRRLGEKASKAEAEVKTLKDELSKLETEKEAKLLEYRHCLEKISDLESSLARSHEDTVVLSQRAIEAELEAQSLKDVLAKIATEKDNALDQYMQSLETIAKLESKLQCAEEDSIKFKERSERAESEVETLKQAISELSQEKELAAIQYQKCLETISSLGAKLSSVEEEAQRLSSEIYNGAAKLKDAEEHCKVLEKSNQAFQSKVETLTQKTVDQSQELAEKQQELGRLWTCIQEERLRFIEAETAFQTLQQLHAQLQEDIRSLSTELKLDNKKLEDEILNVKKENKNLQELNVSSSMTIRDLQEEISSLRDTKGKLEEEVELRLDERNALQQEIYSLKGMLQKENSEKKVLLEKNSVLENSLSDLSAELEAIRGKLKALECSFQSLLEEKSSLTNELLVRNENLEDLSTKNAILEKSLSDVHDELRNFKEKSTALEGSCHILMNVKSDLLGEQERLLNQLQTALLRLESLGKMYADIEQRYSALEKEKEELIISLDKEKNLHASFVQMSNTQLAGMESEMLLLQEECRLRAKENEEELDKAFDSQIQIFILQKSAQDLEGQSSSLLSKYHKLSEESAFSEKLVLELEQRGQQHVLENSVLVTLLSQLKSEAENLHAEKTSIDLEYTSKSNQVCILQNEAIKMQEANEEMKSKIKEKDRNEKLLAVEIENLGSSLRCLQGAYNDLQRENFELLEEKTSMAKEISVLEEENITICGEILSLECISMIFKNCVSENSLELKLLSADLDKLNYMNSEKGEKLSLAERMVEELKLENLNLTMALQRSKDELNTTRLIKSHLDHDIELKNISMLEKEHKIQEIGQKLSLIENEKLELHQKWESLARESTIAKRTTEDLEKQLMALTKECDYLGTENGKMKEQNEELHSELQMQMTEIHTLESEVEDLFGEMQISTFFHGLYEQKVLELMKVIECLEAESTSKGIDIHLLKERANTMDANNEGLKTQLMTVNERLGAEITSKDIDIELLKRKVNNLEAENEGLMTHLEKLFVELHISTVCHCLYEQKVHELMQVNTTFASENTSKEANIKLLNAENENLESQLALCRPAIASLIQCISSLEKHTYGKLQTPNKDVIEAVEVEKKHTGSGEERNATEMDALQDLVTRIQAVEKMLLKSEQLAVEDNLNLNAKLHAALRQIEDLKTDGSLLGVAHPNRRQLEILEAENGILTKDIVLDQISESSPYNMTKREQLEADSQQILELWETSNAVGPTGSDALSEKELGVDKLELSQRPYDLRDGNNKKVLERLNSDLLQLTNLQISVMVLKKKLDITENSRRSGKSTAEHENLKAQLSEAEASIQKLFDQNEEVRKRFESGPYSDNERRISEEARRMSERIGRLQLEVQKIQFVLLEHDEHGKESEGQNSKISEAKRRVLLRDYLYGGARPSQKQKKMKKFCSCIQPHTRDD